MHRRFSHVALRGVVGPMVQGVERQAMARVVGGVKMMAVNPSEWETARKSAATFARRLEPVMATPEEAVGAVLGEALIAQADMPPYDIANLDGWAVSGPGPWSVRRPNKRDMFMGREYHEATTQRFLRDGQAAPVLSGEALGDGVTGVIGDNRVIVEDEILKLNASGRGRSNYVVPGAGVRARGSDAGRGTRLLPAGDRVTPAVAALAAAAGCDAISIIPMPSIGLIRVGDQILDKGIPRSGLTRDAVSPALPGWIAGLRGRCQPARWVTQGDAELIKQIDDVISDVVVTSGPSSGAAVRRVLHGMRADILVDGVECTPGSQMLLAQLQDGRPLIHCGGTPADAMATLATLLAPIIEALTGHPDPAVRMQMDESVPGDRRRTYLLPVGPTLGRGPGLSRVTPGGPGGLFALSQATGLAVIPTGGVRRLEKVTILPIP